MAPTMKKSNFKSREIVSISDKTAMDVLSILPISLCEISGINKSSRFHVAVIARSHQIGIDQKWGNDSFIHELMIKFPERFKDFYVAGCRFTQFIFNNQFAYGGIYTFCFSKFPYYKRTNIIILKKSKYRKIPTYELSLKFIEISPINTFSPSYNSLNSHINTVKKKFKEELEDFNLKDRLLGILKAKKRVKLIYIERFLKIDSERIVGYIFDLIGSGKIDGEFNDDDTEFSMTI